MRINKIKNKIFATIAILAILLTGMTTMNNSVTGVEALNFCTGFGSGMGKSNVNYNVANSDAKNRVWTAEELFSRAVGYTVYYGEGPGDYWYADKVDRGMDRVSNQFGDASLWSDSDVQDRMNGARGMSCTFGAAGITNILPNLLLSATSAIVWFVKLAINTVLGEDFMVKTLVDLVGGDGASNTGLIGTFLHSLYLPMVVIAGLFLAITITWKGIAQRKLREATMDLVWSVSAVIIGLVFMYNPLMMAELPQTITTQVSTCMIGALTGQNCLTNEVTTPSLLAGKECMASFDGSGNSTSTITNSMSCTLWKTFVLEEWAQEQFGTSYNNLYTFEEPEGGTIWSSLPEGSGEKYCVRLGSTNSPDDMSGGIATLDGSTDDRVCNVALYQLYIKTNAHDSDIDGTTPHKLTSQKKGAPYDTRWYNIIVPMAKSGEGWSNWIGKFRAIPRIGSSLMSIIAVIAASWVLIPLSISGAVYKITGVIMMAFAPIFLLLAVEPTKGKTMFLGWLESFASAMLKYFAITMLLIVSLTMYSAMLNNVTGPAALIGVIVMTVALMMYKSEIIEIIGASNMGGKRLSNKVGEGYDKATKKAKSIAVASGGGAIGALLGSKKAAKESLGQKEKELSRLKETLKNSTDPEERSLLEAMKEEQEALIEEESSGKYKRKESRAAMKEGASTASGRVLKRGTGFTGSLFMQQDRTKRALEKEEEKRKSEYEKGEAELNKKIRTNRDDSSGIENWKASESGDLSQVEIKNQRNDKVAYEGELTNEERSALDDFAEKIASATNDDLLDTTDNEELMADDNRRMLVSNEVNARIAAKSLKGEASGDLSRHELADMSNLTSEEREFNINILKDNYLESHDKEDLAKYSAALIASSERLEDGTISKSTIEKNNELIDIVELMSESYRKADVEHERTTPNEKQLLNSPEKFNFKDVELSRPEHLVVKENARLEKEVEKEKAIQEEKDRLDEIENKMDNSKNGPIKKVVNEPSKKESNEVDYEENIDKRSGYSLEDLMDNIKNRREANLKDEINKEVEDESEDEVVMPNIDEIDNE